MTTKTADGVALALQESMPSLTQTPHHQPAPRPTSRSTTWSGRGSSSSGSNGPKWGIVERVAARGPADA